MSRIKTATLLPGLFQDTSRGDEREERASAPGTSPGRKGRARTDQATLEIAYNGETYETDEASPRLA